LLRMRLVQKPTEYIKEKKTIVVRTTDEKKEGTSKPYGMTLLAWGSGAKNHDISHTESTKAFSEGGQGSDARRKSILFTSKN